MKTTFKKFCVALGLLLCVTSGGYAAEGWLTDFDEACAVAKEKGSTMLVEFTGSDWCHWCKVLKANVLSKPEFAAYANEHNLVLVEMDYPNAADHIPAEVRERRAAVRDLYGVRGYPTIIVMDGEGRPYGEVSGAAGSVADYLKRLQPVLDAKQAFEAKLAEARKLSGVERAKALKEVLMSLSPNVRKFHKQLEAEIAENDADDTLGYAKALAEENTRNAQIKEVQDTLTAVVGNRNTIEAMRDARVKAQEMLEREDWLPFVRMTLYAFISRIYFAESNYEESLRNMELAVQAAPDTAEAEDMRTKGIPMLRDLCEKNKKAE